jgi:membrane-associated phospholipid phosphatase
VFAAELACYATLPWLPSRPPRVLDAPAEPAMPGALRALNLGLLAHGSVQANTIPSGHAAGAVAVALSVYSTSPAAGLVFLMAAAGITVATVLGRYHYAVDSILGVIVAIVFWLLLGH